MPLDGQRHANVGFVGLAMDLRPPHAFTSAPSFSSATTSRSAASSLSVCAVVPRVMRTHPSHPGSAERSRTNIPRCRIAATNSRCRSPISHQHEIRLARPPRDARLRAVPVPASRAPPSPAPHSWPRSRRLPAPPAAPASATAFTLYGDDTRRTIGICSCGPARIPMRSPASPYAFENVRATNRLGCLPTSDITVFP